MTIKLNEKELPTVTRFYVERNFPRRKSIEKVWAVNIYMRFLSICLQVIVPIAKYFQHDILNFSKH